MLSEFYSYVADPVSKRFLKDYLWGDDFDNQGFAHIPYANTLLAKGMTHNSAVCRILALAELYHLMLFACLKSYQENKEFCLNCLSLVCSLGYSAINQYQLEQICEGNPINDAVDDMAEFFDPTQEDINARIEKLFKKAETDQAFDSIYPKEDETLLRYILRTRK